MFKLLKIYFYSDYLCSICFINQFNVNNKSIKTLVRYLNYREYGLISHLSTSDTKCLFNLLDNAASELINYLNSLYHLEVLIPRSALMLILTSSDQHQPVKWKGLEWL